MDFDILLIKIAFNPNWVRGRLDLSGVSKFRRGGWTGLVWAEG